MTNWLKLFLAFYILVGQPALLGWMLDNCNLYKLAWLNAWVFLISWLISTLLKSSNNMSDNENKVKLVEKSEEKVSRIENDNGVSIVEVAKKEVAAETNNDESNKSLIENKDEKMGDKSEEKASDRPMRENVTIPKIVQPLSWHSASTNKKKKKELKRGQRLIFFLTLGLAVVIAWTLWEFLESWWMAIALFLWRILYLVIWKLFDVNWFYNAKKLFTNWSYIILILAWIGYGVYAMQNDNSFNLIKNKVASYMENLFNSKKASRFGTWEEIYVFEWTWEVIVNTWTEIEALDTTWATENNIWNDNVNTWIIEDTQTVVNVEPEITEQPEVKSEIETLQPTFSADSEASAPTTDNPNREVTWWEAIKHLLQWYKLSTKTDKTFVYVAKSNELYPYFKTAQEKAMIWFDVNPSKRISCETYMSLKWILEWWSVNIYDKSQTRIIYWNKANELGKTNWCAKWAFVKVKNL